MKHILFIIKTPNKKELQQVVPTHPSDIDFKDFMNVFKYYTKDYTSAFKNNALVRSCIRKTNSALIARCRRCIIMLMYDLL